MNISVLRFLIFILCLFCRCTGSDSGSENSITKEDPKDNVEGTIVVSDSLNAVVSEQLKSKYSNCDILKIINVNYADTLGEISKGLNIDSSLIYSYIYFNIEEDTLLEVMIFSKGNFLNTVTVDDFDKSVLNIPDTL